MMNRYKLCVSESKVKLQTQVISVDRPNGYITRVNKENALQIPVDIGSFNERVLSRLAQVYHSEAIG